MMKLSKNGSNSFTPSIAKRLDLVEKLASEGLFVRIMSMPFYGEKKDLVILKKETSKRGAKAFKNKGLNYYKWEDLDLPRTFQQFIDDKMPRSKCRTDEKEESLIIRNGENVVKNGKFSKVKFLFPNVDSEFKADDNWAAMEFSSERLKTKTMKKIDCGYRYCNKVDWGYII